MPIEVQRFGVGHRRADGPAGTTGVSGQVIHSDGRGVISELAFARNGRIEPHTSPNSAWFIVIEGGGWVVVDGEAARVAAGEAVFWPADIPHGAWADHGHMRAFVVEFAGADDTVTGRLIEGGPVVEIAERLPVERGMGALRGDGPEPPHDPDAGEPH